MALSALSLPTSPVSSSDYHQGIPHPSITSCPSFQSIPCTFKPPWHSSCLKDPSLPSFSILGTWGLPCSPVLSLILLPGAGEDLPSVYHSSSHYLPDLIPVHRAPRWTGEERPLLGDYLFKGEYTPIIQEGDHGGSKWPKNLHGPYSGQFDMLIFNK